MSMSEKAMRNERSRGKGRTVSGVVNSIETLEGGGFLVRRPFPKPAFFPSLSRSCYLMRWGQLNLRRRSEGRARSPASRVETVTYLQAGTWNIGILGDTPDA